MASKPSTPVVMRRAYPGENELTRIPILTNSPTPFRRSCSLSLRLRPTSFTNEFSVRQRNHHHQKQPAINKKTVLGNNIMDKQAGENMDLVDHSPQSKSESYKIQPKTANHCNGTVRKHSLSQHDRGMSLNLNGNGGQSSRTSRSPQTPRTPHSGYIKSTPKSPKTPPVTPDVYIDDDLDSLHSYSSMASGMSSGCDHHQFARNGTTFSGRKMKYVVHCSNFAGQAGEDYLTPTQRAQKHIRRLKELLAQARYDLEQKDGEILRLTREVVELRLFKASLSSPEERSNSSDCTVPTVRENTTNDLHTPASEIASPMIDMVDDAFSKSSPRHMSSLGRPSHHQHGIHQVQFLDKLSNSEMQSSFADSGHFEDITTSSMHSKDSFAPTQERGCGSDEDIQMDHDRQRLVQMYEEKIEELIKQHDCEMSEEKRSNNDRMEALLTKLSQCNERYCEIIPDYETAKERIRELEKQLEKLQHQLELQGDKSNKMYLAMYTKGQEAERIQHADKSLDISAHASNRVTVPELMQQLQVTQDELENLRDERFESSQGSNLISAKEAISLWLLSARKTMYKRVIDAQKTKKVDPEVTLQFLKSAIYYFLTDKENSQGHLSAIESILGFTDKEKSNIEKARSSK